MTQDEEYAISCHPGRGPGIPKGFQPFQVGHYFVLTRLKNPLLEDPGSMGPGDLATAMWVAKRDQSNARKLLGSVRMRLMVKSYAQLIKASGEYEHYAWINLMKWRDYHTTRMQMWGSVTEGEDGVTLPFLHVCKRALMGEMGYTLEEMLSMPIRLAMADVQLWAESKEGKSSKIITDKQRKFMESWLESKGLKGGVNG